MAAGSTSGTNTAAIQRESWTPMIAIALGQVLLAFNTASLPVALSGLVKTFGVPPTTVAASIVMYSLAVAGFVMLGAKLNQRFGAVRVFRAVVILFGVAQALMTFSPDATAMIVAQGLCGVAGAALVAAFMIGGILGTYIGWRPAFGILMVLAFVVFILSLRFAADRGHPEVQIDIVGVILAAASIILISLGFNNLTSWGAGFAGPAAPFDLLGVSPAPIMILIGIVLGQAFISWTRRRQANEKTPLLAMDVMNSPQQRAAVYAVFSVGALEAMLNFSMPLYIQIVQGRSPLETAIAMMPFNLSIFIAALLVVKLYDKLTPQQIGRYGFIICAIALLWLAFVVRNDWSKIPVIIGLVAFGLGQGSLITLVFNVLVTASPKSLAGDVGALRGTTQNLAVAIGTAVGSALLVGLLGAAVMRSLAATPLLPAELQSQVDLDNINFVSNDHLKDVLVQTTATPAQVDEAVRINTEARLRALKIGLLVMAAIALLTVAPAGRLPSHIPGKGPIDDRDARTERDRTSARTRRSAMRSG
jgi:MFS family permease